MTEKGAIMRKVKVAQVGLGHRGYGLLKEIVSEMYPGITFIPSVMAGGTDSRYYCDITPTKSVYRFTGIMSSKRSGGAHQVNEHIDTEIIENNVKFYIELFSRYGK